MSCHLISYHIVVLIWQNRLKVGTDKPKLKVKMQSVSDDDVQKRLIESHVLSWWRKALLYCCVCITFSDLTVHVWLAIRRQLRLVTGWARRRPTQWLYRSFRSWRVLRSGWTVSRAPAASGRWWAWSMYSKLITTAAQTSRITGTLMMAPRTSW